MPTQTPDTIMNEPILQKQQQQQLLLDTKVLQDSLIQSLELGVRRLNVQAHMIGEHITTSTRLLDDLDSDVIYNIMFYCNGLEIMLFISFLKFVTLFVVMYSG